LAFSSPRTGSQELEVAVRARLVEQDPAVCFCAGDRHGREGVQSRHKGGDQPRGADRREARQAAHRPAQQGRRTVRTTHRLSPSTTTPSAYTNLCGARLCDRETYAEQLEKFKLALAHKCLHSSNLEKRLFGINTVTTLINEAQRKDENKAKAATYTYKSSFTASEILCILS
jgi:hypothetical protein